MDRSIGINIKKEAAAMMRYKKFPALNHNTKVHTGYSYDNDSLKNTYEQGNSSTGDSDMGVEFSLNNHTYKLNKQNLAAIGVGALVAFSAYKAFKAFNRMY